MIKSWPSQTIEKYLETIYILASEGRPVIAARIAETVGVSAPTVTQTLRKMAADGYVDIADRRDIRLTPTGEEVAASVMRRHRVIERWLSDELKLDWTQAHAEAVRMEHALSPEVADRLYERMGRPATCPHGNPIPGGDHPFRYSGDKTLDRAVTGEQVRVARIAEDAEEDMELLRLLHANGIMPGAKFRVAGLAGGRMSLQRDASSFEVPVRVASKVWITEA